MIGRMVRGARIDTIPRKGLRAKRHTIMTRSGENASRYTHSRTSQAVENIGADNAKLLVARNYQICFPLRRRMRPLSTI